jgi:hypothetical protein
MLCTADMGFVDEIHLGAIVLGQGRHCHASGWVREVVRHSVGEHCELINIGYSFSPGREYTEVALERFPRGSTRVFKE